MRVLVVLALVFALAISSSRAGAAGNGTQVSGTGSDTTDTISASVTITATSVGYQVDGYRPSSGGSVSMLCYYFGLKDSEGSYLFTPDYEAGPVWPPVPEESYLLSCYTNGTYLTGNVVVDQLLVYDPANPLGPIAAEQLALDQARSQVQLPTPDLRTAPPSGALMVGLPAWYWIEGWAPVTTSATVGGTTSTVTATPTSASWSPGDDSAPVTCPGPGEAWQAGVDHRFPPCGHLYTDAGDVTLSVTVTWTVTWSSTTGVGGPLPPLTTTASVALDIGQAQAVLT